MTNFLIKRSIIVSVLKAAGAASFLVFGILISRYLGEEAFGVFSLAVVFVSFGSILNKLGLDLYVLRKVVEYLNSDLLFSFMVKVLIILVITSTISVLILTLYKNFWLEVVFQSTLEEKFYDLLVVAIVLMSVFSVIVEVIRAKYGPTLYSCFKFTLLPSTVLLFFVISTLILHIPVEPVFLYFLTASGLSVLMIIWLISLLIKERKRSLKARLIYSKPILKHSAPMMMIASMIFIMGYIDTFMINYYLNAEQVGYYSAVMRVSAALSFVTSAVETIVARDIARHHIARKGLRTHFYQTVKAVFIISAPLFLLIIIFSEEILSIYGTSFAQYGEVLLIYSFAVFLNCLPIGYYYVMTDRQQQLQYIIFISVVLNIVLNVMLIPAAGIKGAAIATLISNILWNLTAFLNLKRCKVV